jgi:hypothetical protein
MINKDITIFMSESDVERWKYFQLHYTSFVTLIDNKAFDVGYGKTILNFNDSKLKSLTKEEVLWRKP